MKNLEEVTPEEMLWGYINISPWNFPEVHTALFGEYEEYRPLDGSKLDNNKMAITFENDKLTKLLELKIVRYYDQHEYFKWLEFHKGAKQNG